jgi:hypothetical protein
MTQGLPSSAATATRRPTAPGRGSVPAWLCIGLVLVSAVAYAEYSDAHKGAFLGDNRGTLRISGHVTGLYPGVTKALRVKFRNRYPGRVVITGLRVVVKDASPRCPAASLRVERFKSRIRVRKRGRLGFPLGVTLSPDVGDGCQGALFPLVFKARVRARR